MVFPLSVINFEGSVVKEKFYLTPEICTIYILNVSAE